MALEVVLFILFIAFSWYLSALICNTRKCRVIYFGVSCEIYFRYLETYYIIDYMRIICFPLRVWNYYHEINDLCEVTFQNMYYFLLYIKSRGLGCYTLHHPQTLLM